MAALAVFLAAWMIHQCEKGGVGNVPCGMDEALLCKYRVGNVPLVANEAPLCKFTVAVSTP